MAERSDIFVRWNLSPRVIVVEAPSTELTMQDLVDTSRRLEMQLDNIDDDYLLDAAGKEDLGGGTLVGITVTLNNAVVQFEGRTISFEQGTITTASGEGNFIIDDTATFKSSGITTGDMIMNITDQSMTDVVEVISETELKCNVLDDGSDNQFELNDEYKVWPIVECDLSGGNLVSLDENGLSILPFLGSPNVVLSRVSSSSGTLSDIEAIQYSSYQNSVWVDVNSGQAGVSYPSGTRESPVNNIQDAVIIGKAKGLSTLAILSDITLDAGDNVSDFCLYGKNPVQTTLLINPDAITDNCRIQELKVSGTLDGNATIDRCLTVGNINYIYGYIMNSMIAGSITLAGGHGCALLNCYSYSELDTYINMGGTGQNLLCRNFTGRIHISNLTDDSNDVSLDMLSGEVYIEPTVTAGFLDIRGIATLYDNSTGTAVVSDEDLLNRKSITSSIWGTQNADHLLPGSTGESLDNASNTEIITIF